MQIVNGGMGILDKVFGWFSTSSEKEGNLHQKLNDLEYKVEWLDSERLRMCSKHIQTQQENIQILDAVDALAHEVEALLLEVSLLKERGEKEASQRAHLELLVKELEGKLREEPVRVVKEEKGNGISPE